MKVGDLVQWKGADAHKWYGVITKRRFDISFYVVWPSGAQGWFMVDDLEVVCK